MAVLRPPGALPRNVPTNGSPAATPLMSDSATRPDKIIDRQVGRNAELFADSIAQMATPEERYPYLRILISIVEQAHPELNQAPQKDRQVAHLVASLGHHKLDMNEIADVVRVRDEERGYFYD